jgi:dual specificity phosphatase 12
MAASNTNTDNTLCANEIAAGVWLGSQAALDPLLEAKDIGLVITAITEYELRMYDICERVGNRPWIWIPMDDDEDGDIIRFFSASNTAIEFALAAGKEVLIHCAAGVSRSATLAIAYLMWKQDIDHKAAHKLVVAKRPFINPNDAFCAQLELYDEILRTKPWMPIIPPTTAHHSLAKDASESTASE